MVQTAAFDPIVVEPRLTPEKIEELITHGVESAKLDYKAEYSPSEAKSRLQLVKHAVAMANTVGGYIVIGIHDDGTVVGVQAADLARIDEATIRAQIAGFTSVPIPLFVDTTVQYDDKSFAVVTVLPLGNRLVVVNSDGQYSEPNKNQFVFRKGDVLVRHGSASERWNQNDAEYMISRIAGSEKERWQREFSDDFRRMFQYAFGQDVPEIPQRPFDLSPDEFQNLSIRLLRGGSHG